MTTDTTFQEEIMGDVSILRFPRGSIDPPFIIDYCNVKNSLLEWIEDVKQERGSFCTINGLTKSGKTAALTRILPALVKSQFPDAIFFHISFDTIAKQGLNMRSFLMQFLGTGYSWAKKHGIDVERNPTDSPIEDLLNHIRRFL